MMAWITLATRNLFRNRRRSLFTIIAIALGFAAVNVLGGFTDYMFSNLENSYIHIQANGHLTLFRPGFLKEGKLSPTRYLLDGDTLHGVADILHDYPEVVVVTPQLHISGLLSNGKVSTIFIAIGRVWSDVRSIRARARGGFANNLKLGQGRDLDDELSYGVGLSEGLAEQLDLKLGVTAVAMAPTIKGQINALDAEVLQLFPSAIEALNDKLMVVPLKFAQDLYDTTSVDRITILLQQTAQTESVKSRLAADFSRRGLNLEIRSWDELSTMYAKVRAMFDIIFNITFVIVFTIVVMSVVNTVSMSIIERTREIGTLRALGTKRSGIVTLFAIESMLLGLVGSCLGVFLTLLTWACFAMIKPTWNPPMISVRVPLEIYLVPSSMFFSALLLVFLSLVAATVPARKAARISIVNALGHS